jgi:Cu-processing system ATP-binding protein
MIQFAGMSKTYGSIQALKGVTVSLRDGAVTAIAGPNGSGKSTLIKILLGLVKAQRGQINFFGNILNGHYEYRRLIGYMPQEAQFPENLRVREVIDMVKQIRQSETTFNESLVEQFGLHKELPKRIFSLSGGTKQKLNASLAFMVPSQLLVLDEPTAGLDPVCSSILKEEILKRKSRGDTILITSHISSEIEELADDIIFLCEGEVVFHGSMAHLKGETGFVRLEPALAHLMRKGKQ